MTLVEAILARAAGQDRVQPGQVVTARVDRAMANDITAPLAIAQLRAAGGTRVWNPARVSIVAGRHAPFRDAQQAEAVAGIARFCREQGIAHFYGHGEGMDHALVQELGLVQPGMLVANADSHAATIGALGAVGVPVGSTDMAYILAFGETWLRVPATIRVCFTGVRGRWTTSKDMVLALAGRLGVDGARYKALEFTGPALAALTVDERFTIANMAVEMGAKTGIMAPDAAVDAYLAARGAAPAAVPDFDPAAAVEAELAIDAGGLPPLVSRPGSPADVTEAGAGPGTAITQVNIGTCTNGRVIDLEQAAEVLRGRRVAPGVRLIVTPATAIVHREAQRRGLMDVFLDAGATVAPPGCGACAGWHMGILGPDDVAVTTHNRNFRGRMGHPDAQIYLASPYVAAASAVAGRVASPAEVVG